MTIRFFERSARSRRGNAAATIAALLPMLGFVALVVDVGVLQYAHSELQLGVDAAALSGAGYLNGTELGVTRAIHAAIEIGGQNSVLNKPIELTLEDVKVGYYDPQEDTFVFTLDPVRANALWVEKDVAEIGTFFASAAFGRHFMETRAHSVAKATASHGVGISECFLPIAIPDCMLSKADEVESYKVRFYSAGEDNAGWAEVNNAPSAASIRDQLQGLCTQGEASVFGDSVGLNNGVITYAMGEIGSALRNSTTPWDPTKYGPLPPPMGSPLNTDDGGSRSTHTNYGFVIEGPIILFEARSGVCGASTQFNQMAPITGFAWGVIYDVDDHGSGKNMRMKIDFTNDHLFGDAGGGLETNAEFREFGLVY